MKEDDENINKHSFISSTLPKFDHKIVEEIIGNMMIVVDVIVFYLPMPNHDLLYDLNRTCVGAVKWASIPSLKSLLHCQRYSVVLYK